MAVTTAPPGESDGRPTIHFRTRDYLFGLMRGLRVRMSNQRSSETRQKDTAHLSIPAVAADFVFEDGAGP